MRINFCKFLPFVALLSFVAIKPINAQSNYSFSAGGGMIYYNGDLHDNSFLWPHSELVNAYYNFNASVLLIDRLEMSIGYLHGKIEGDDALSVNKYNRKRNLTFFSPIDEVNLSFRLKLNSALSEEVVNPYVMLGFGYFWFNPQAELNGTTYELQPLGTEGQFIEGSGNPAPYNLSTGSLTFGLGVEFRANKHFAIRLEGAPHFTFTDYLDDASTNYPDSAGLAGTPNGEIAVLLSSRDERGFQPERINRGNSGKNDIYFTLGLGVIFTPDMKYKKLNPKPGILNKDLRSKKGWRKK